MREIVGKAYTDLGRELHEAQQELAKHGYGCFQAWAESIGIKRNKAYDLIRRYETIVRISDEQTRELLEYLPVSLTYEIAKPSAESTPAKAKAKAEVLAGEIDTLKAYRERIAELEQRAEQAEEHEFIIGISDDKKQLIESLPTSLTDEITKPSAESTPAKLCTHLNNKYATPFRMTYFCGIIF